MNPQPHLHPAFGTVLNNFTSDHTWQSISATCVSKEEKPLQTLHIATWNTLEKCRSKKDNGDAYSNNPIVPS